MNIPRRLLLFTALSAQVLAAAAADPVAQGTGGDADTAQHKCENCPFETGMNGEVEVGVGDVSDDSFKFGDYTGLNEEGAYFIGNADLRYRGEDARYWDLTAEDLGLDSRALNVEGGRQGVYKWFLDYSELPKLLLDTSRSPFLGEGGDVLSLPPGWVPAGTTGGMTALPGSLRDVDIFHERERLGLGFTAMPSQRWQYTLKYRHEIQEGTKTIGGAFLTNAAILPEPVDYVTDQLDAIASYSGSKWQAQFAYYGSFFSNENESLTWQNPFTDLNNETAGQLALPPENQFHQIGVTAGYQLSPATRTTANLAIGRMEQDETFLPYTTNPTIAGVGPLPGSSLDGQVDTLNAKLGITSAVTDKLRLAANYVYDDRDNDTPQLTYDRVVTDVFLSGSRTNLPYSFTRSELKLSADYRFNRRIKFALGLDDDTHERTFQEVEETDEQTAWAKLKLQPRDDLDVTLKYAQSDRDGSAYEPVPEITPPQNPLLRKYNMADRERDQMSLYAAYTPHERIGIGFGIDTASDDYTASTLGLTESEDMSYSVDASLLVTRNMSAHAFVTREEIESEQLGSQTFSTADWSGDEKDTIDTFGVGLKFAAIKDKLDISADYVYSKSIGEIHVESVAPDPPFPDLMTKLNSFKLYADYKVKSNLSVRLGYYYEKYETDDWALDGVNPDTISNVLTLGEDSPSYDIDVITASVRYRF